MKELISVIVPVYKVEPYLRRCVDSILCQTYSNLEIFLVDDGSPDGCPAICDAYAEKDSRIRVIHKANGGLSDARNAALDVARGAYYAFVDSDDFISPDYIETLYETLRQFDADLSVVGMRRVFQDSMALEDTRKEARTCCYDTKAAVLQLLTWGDFSHEACGKLYKAELFGGIRFPAGELYEDLAIMYSVILRTQRVVYTDCPLYQYFIREGSIMQRPFDMRQYVEVRWIENAMALVAERYPELDAQIRGRRVWSYFKTLYRILCSGDSKQYQAQQEALIGKIRVDASGLLSSPEIGRNLKVKIMSLYLGKYGFYCVQKVSDWIKQIKAGQRYHV